MNELSTVTRSGTLTVEGNTTTVATNVTVNGLTAIRYADLTYARTNFPLVDAATNFTAIAQSPIGLASTNTVTVDLRATTTLVYDLNGNLRTNGTQVLEYDDENRLVTNYVAATWKSEFVYDGDNRRRIQRDYGWSDGGWVRTNEAHLVYDGNVILQHRDANNAPTLTLTRGLDLAGSFQGAGGIGGLLAMTEANGTSSYYHSDANGNVTALINANQLIVGRYAYDPFGCTLSISGPKAFVNPYRFSSKPIHDASGKYDSLRRWYDPSLQRWLNPDPIGELGGLNLFSYVGNNPVNLIDLFGLSQQDVNAILNGYNQATAEMNQAGHRVGWFPPLSSLKAWGWNPNGRGWDKMLGGNGWECVHQSAFLTTELKQINYDDNWNIRSKTSPDLHHTWVEATSSNPSDPSIRLDPWYGRVNVQPSIISSSPGAFPPISNTTVNNIPTVTIPAFPWGRGHP